ncbi:MAG TPA: hypothetical protein VFD70_30145 [Anaerolineae bacterium]|nr:hypothetical protein [Anaerolineae bacterium]
MNPNGSSQSSVLAKLSDASDSPELHPDEIREFESLLRQLDAWQAPTPTAQATAQLVTRLSPLVPAVSPVRRAMSARSKNSKNQLIGLLLVARAQISLLRPSFWLLSASVTLLGLVVILSTNMSKTFVLLALGPLLCYLATVSVFRGVGLNVLEFELACPPSVRQLTLARLVIVLGYDISLGMLLSVTLSASSQGLVMLTLHWLAPLLLVAGATLLLSLRMPLTRAASFIYSSWLVILLAAWLFNDKSDLTATFTATLELLVGVAGLVFLFIAVRYSTNAVPHLLPHQ